MQCNFCDIVNKQSSKINDIVLYEDDYFIITPTLGSLTSNYLLIISKSHCTSMMQLDINQISHLEILLNKLRDSYYLRFGFYPIIFEHGTFSDITASSVSHAHLHIVPYILKNITFLEKPFHFKKAESIRPLKRILDKTSYLFYIDNSNYHFYFALEGKVKSQFFRRLIATELGIYELWDWKKEIFSENIRATVLESQLLLNRLTPIGTIKNIYYSRAIDKFDNSLIKESYMIINHMLNDNNLNLLNSYSESIPHIEDKSKKSVEIVGTNLSLLRQADCLFVDLSIQNHLYIGCIDEMVCAYQMGIHIIIIGNKNELKNRLYIKFRANIIVNSIEEAIKEINRINFTKTNHGK